MINQKDGLNIVVVLLYFIVHIFCCHFLTYDLSKCDDETCNTTELQTFQGVPSAFVVIMVQLPVDRYYAAVTPTRKTVPEESRTQGDFREQERNVDSV